MLTSVCTPEPLYIKLFVMRWYLGDCVMSNRDTQFGIDGAGQGESRGVKGQVQQLLQDAQSADKLCKMYVGWSAWL